MMHNVLKDYVYSPFLKDTLQQLAIIPHSLIPKLRNHYQLSVSINLPVLGISYES